ncbi:MAG: hypothetical protein JWN30_1828 [Bacilli bacterium]|nr:hypothetical protein [Bacilli bacterium]
MRRFDEWREAGRKYYETVSDEQFIRDSRRAGIKFVSAGSLRGKPGVKLKLRSGEIITVLGSAKQMSSGEITITGHSRYHNSLVSTAVAASQLAQTAKGQGRRAAAGRTVPRHNRTHEGSR